MPPYVQKVLITGCSDGGMGAALATAFHKHGLEVYATARNSEKMKGLASLGIKTFSLDVLSESSIAACAAQISSLDILVNNAGAMETLPITDTNLPRAKEMFDLNVWSYVAMTQAFLPLLLNSPHGMIVNHTSTQVVTPIPFTGVYGASKAAIGMITQHLRLELQPFKIRVIEMRTGAVQTNIIKNSFNDSKSRLPEGSIYSFAKDIVEHATEKFTGEGPTAEEWADSMARQLLKKNPSLLIWSGATSGLSWLWTWFPVWWPDSTVKSFSGVDVIEQRMRERSAANKS